MEDGIEHHVIWSSVPLEAEEVDEVIQRNRPEGCEYVWFVNPLELRSVPKVGTFMQDYVYEGY